MLRLLALVLTLWEPVSFAVAAAGAINAIGVRGLPVVLVLMVRLATTATCVAAGRALLDRRPSAPTLAKVALVGSGAVQLVAQLTPWFPTNRPPGDAPLYVAWTILFYGGWSAYAARSKRLAAFAN